MQTRSKYLRFGLAITVIVVSLGYLAFTGIEASKSYYVTIAELEKMGEDVHSKRLRVAGNVQPGSIQLKGVHADFVLVEQDKTMRVAYRGSEPPPDTFNDQAEALVEGYMGQDGVFQAKKIQAKCASKYEPKEDAQHEQYVGSGAPSPHTAAD